MTYGQAYLSGWKETFNFSGRASRQQFWTFFLINVLIAAAPVAAWSLATLVDPHYGILSFVVIPFAALWLLLMALPLLAVGCRRMHDIGRSGAVRRQPYRRTPRSIIARILAGICLSPAHSSHRSPE